MAIKIINPIDGEIMNRRHGNETADGLAVTVGGECPEASGVTVNGVPAELNADKFSASLTLTDRETNIVAKTDKGEEYSITVLYDRGSFKRYRFSLDDNIWFLRDIARNAGKYKSLYENPYLALWKRLHDTYGTKVVCNLYYQCEDFNLTMMPDKFKGEWRDNAHWFKLTFHALQNDPKEPYINATYDEIARDYDLVANEVLRFAGEDVLGDFTTIHWGEAPLDACRAVRDRGIRGLMGYFIFKDGVPKVSYYLNRDVVSHFQERDYWKDLRENLFFIRHAIVANNVPLDKIAAHMEEAVSVPTRGEVLELMIHEQYFYPDYVAHEPDYAERCEATVKWAAENDYKPVFWADGFLGVPE